MFAPKARVRYVPTSGPVRAAVVLHRIAMSDPFGSGTEASKVNDVDAYVIRLACGRKLTTPASQIQPKIER